MTPPRSALVAAGCTAAAALFVCALTLVLRAAGGLSGPIAVLAGLTSSFAVLGALAAVLGAVVGWVRARAVPLDGQAPAPGRASAGPPWRWLWLTALFLALSAPLIVYLLAVLWLTNALYVALCLAIVCVPAALAFVPVGRLTLRSRPGPPRA